MKPDTRKDYAAMSAPRQFHAEAAGRLPDAIPWRHGTTGGWVSAEYLTDKTTHDQQTY